MVVLTSSKEETDLFKSYNLGRQLHPQTGGLQSVRRGCSATGNLLAHAQRGAAIIDHTNDNSSGELRVLIVEDSEDDAALLLMELRRGRWKIVHERVDTPRAMADALAAHPWDLIIADYSMPYFSGPAALTMLRERAGDIPFILVSGQVGEETAVQAMKAGANEYLFKGDLQRLVPAVERELRDLEGRRNAEHIERQLRKGERQLADAQRLAHLGTWHVDLQTNVAIWSDEARRIIGCPTEGAGLTFRQFPRMSLTPMSRNESTHLSIHRINHSSRRIVNFLSKRGGPVRPHSR